MPTTRHPAIRASWPTTLPTAPVAAATARAALGGSALATDGLATVLWGFPLASIALVGQVYQLQSPLWQALLPWAVATTPLLLLGGLYLAYEGAEKIYEMIVPHAAHDRTAEAKARAAAAIATRTRRAT